MAKKSSRVPLYEFMSRKNGQPGPAPGVRTPESPGISGNPGGRGLDPSRPLVTHDESGWIGPGRQISLPVGYALVAGALVVALLVGAFIIGYRRGETDERSSFDQDLLAQTQVDEQSALTLDPLLNRSSAGGPLNPGGKRTAAAGIEPGGPSVRLEPPTWGPIDSDPRVPGKKYFVLMETRQQGALQLADFCREEGLEAYIVPSNNTGLYRVIVLPLLETTNSRDPLVARVRAEIDRVGRKWKTSARGRSDLSDAYIDD